MVERARLRWWSEQKPRSTYRKMAPKGGEGKPETERAHQWRFSLSLSIWSSNWGYDENDERKASDFVISFLHFCLSARLLCVCVDGASKNEKGALQSNSTRSSRRYKYVPLWNPLEKTESFFPEVLGCLGTGLIPRECYETTWLSGKHLHWEWGNPITIKLTIIVRHRVLEQTRKPHFYELQISRDLQ